MPSDCPLLMLCVFTDVPHMKSDSLCATVKATCNIQGASHALAPQIGTRNQEAVEEHDANQSGHTVIVVRHLITHPFHA